MKAITAIGVAMLLVEFGLMALAQVDLLSQELTSFLSQLPFVGILIWLIIKARQWFEDNEQRWHGLLKEERGRLEKNETTWRGLLAEERSRADQHYQALTVAHQQAQREQRELFKMALSEQREMYTESLGRLEVRYGQMSDRVELLTQQVALNTTATNEVAKTDDIIERLISLIKEEAARK